VALGDRVAKPVVLVTLEGYHLLDGLVASSLS
jgi:hypothetical protein